jgi:hypothetical protein
MAVAEDRKGVFVYNGSAGGEEREAQMAAKTWHTVLVSVGALVGGTRIARRTGQSVRSGKTTGSA